jgi:hypothetical protein
MINSLMVDMRSCVLIHAQSTVICARYDRDIFWKKKATRTVRARTSGYSAVG